MTNAEARFSKSLRPRKPEGSLGRTAQDVHLDSHTAPELCVMHIYSQSLYTATFRDQKLCEEGGGPGLSFPMPFIPLFLKSHTVPVEVKHHETKPKKNTVTAELLSCVKVEVAVLCLPSLKTVSVDVSNIEPTTTTPV